VFLACVAAAGEPDGSLGATRVIVEAIDSGGRSLRSAPGFVWDDTTVVTTCSALEGAARLQIHAGDFNAPADRMTSCSSALDLAMVRTGEEMPLEPLLAGADILSTGDTVYYFPSPAAGSQVGQARVKGWTDSGLGFELAQLDPKPVGVRSPLLSAAGKVVGWVSEGLVVPLRGIYMSLAGHEGEITLRDLGAGQKFWSLYRAQPSASKDEIPETTAMKTLNGPAACRFRIAVPESWSSDMSTRGSNCLLMAMHGRFGATLALRVSLQQSDDLVQELERVETLMLPGMSRSDMAPFTTDHFTGMRAVYEDPAPGHETTVFTAISGRQLYVLTLTYPQKFASGIEPLVEEILSSFRIE
jgi:hypothetical protein